MSEESQKCHKGEAKTKLESLGIEIICEWIEDGQSMNEIAKKIGVSRKSLTDWVNNEQNASISAQARSVSAEAWLDKGLETIHSSLYKDSGIDPSAARAYAQECARRAALRNKKYVEKTAHTISGDEDGAPLKIQRIERIIVKASDPNS